MEERIERDLKCPKCLHEWVSRKLEPKECPHCKKRLDWKVCDYTLPKAFGDKEFLDTFDHPVKLHRFDGMNRDLG